MTKARKSIINVSDTPYYHCMGRCVRRAFLCGVDEFSGNDYSHRKQWIVDKLAELSAVFMIDVCAYAVMSNHYHLVLKINQEQAMQLSDELVIERWMMLFAGNVLVQRYLKGECKTQAELDKVQEIIVEWRERLSDISWFMRCLNETIAHRANEEDNCSGRFWEGRFKSQALLNEQALLSCMAYVDLNPVRVGIAESLDESEFTSIEQRVKEIVLSPESLVISRKKGQKIKDNPLSPPLKNGEVKRQKKGEVFFKLADFVGGFDKEGIPYRFVDYLELVDWSGRAIRDDKTGYIDQKEPKILDKIGFTPDIWFKSMKQFSEHSYSHIGSEDQLRAICEDIGNKWMAGVKNSRILYG